MNLRQIARAGMKGKKKDAFLLNFIIILSFLFFYDWKFAPVYAAKNGCPSE